MAFDVQNGVTGAINGVEVTNQAPATKPVKEPKEEGAN